MKQNAKYLVGGLVGVVILAAAYFGNGGTFLQGKIGPIDAAKCTVDMQNKPIYWYYTGGGTTTVDYKYKSFKDFTAGLKDELALNNGKTVCPYRFVIHKDIWDKSIQPGAIQSSNLLVNCPTLNSVPGSLRCVDNSGPLFVLEITEKNGKLEGKYVYNTSNNINNYLGNYVSTDNLVGSFSLNVTTIPSSYIK